MDNDMIGLIAVIVVFVSIMGFLFYKRSQAKKNNDEKTANRYNIIIGVIIFVVILLGVIFGAGGGLNISDIFNMF